MSVILLIKKKTSLFRLDHVSTSSTDMGDQSKGNIVITRDNWGYFGHFNFNNYPHQLIPTIHDITRTPSPFCFLLFLGICLNDTFVHFLFSILFRNQVIWITNFPPVSLFPCPFIEEFDFLSNLFRNLHLMFFVILRAFWLNLELFLSIMPEYSFVLFMGCFQFVL